MVQRLAEQVRSELGERQDGSSQQSAYKKDQINGDATVTIEMMTDFAKKEDVHEHYVLVSDGKDGEMKIKDLKWDY